MRITGSREALQSVSATLERHGGRVIFCSGNQPKRMAPFARKLKALSRAIGHIPPLRCHTVPNDFSQHQTSMVIVFIKISIMVVDSCVKDLFFFSGWVVGITFLLWGYSLSFGLLTGHYHFILASSLHIE